MEFEWDINKEQTNIAKHGVDFAEASTVFGDPLELTIADPDHSIGELRFLSLAYSTRHRLLVVSYPERGDRIRIISARPATSSERKYYESNQG